VSGAGKGRKLACSCADPPMTRRSELLLRSCLASDWVGNAQGHLVCEERPAASKATVAALREGGHGYAAKVLETIMADAADHDEFRASASGD
jgi:hypothetical protein